jgi:RNA polymerase-binding transcription factor DksA
MFIGRERNEASMAAPAASPAHESQASIREALEDQWRRDVAQLVQLSMELCDARSDGYVVGDDSVREMVARVAALRLSLRDIEAALLRLEEGRYGRCEQCGTAIRLERLEVMPQTRYCVDCQRSSRVMRNTSEDLVRG